LADIEILLFEIGVAWQAMRALSPSLARSLRYLQAAHEAVRPIGSGAPPVRLGRY
jgi:hypothetical protein